jgi:hypothetical protein
MPNYGLIHEPIVVGEHYELRGYTKIDSPVVNPSGDWEKYAPLPENQGSPVKFFDSRNCVGYGTLNALETLARFWGYDFPHDCSERYAGVTGGNTKNGNSPHRMIEAIRAWAGVIPESTLPFSEHIHTWEDYYHPSPMSPDFLSLGYKAVQRFDIGHEWVFNGNDEEDKAVRLMDALKRGTVGVSVRAWSKGKNGLYKKSRKQADTHWVQLVGFVEGKYWRVFDSYDVKDKNSTRTYFKDLEWDYNFDMAKVYYLSLRNQADRNDFLTKLIQKLTELLASLTKPLTGLWKRY